MRKTWVLIVLVGLLVSLCVVTAKVLGITRVFDVLPGMSYNACGCGCCGGNPDLTICVSRSEFEQVKKMIRL